MQKRVMGPLGLALGILRSSWQNGSLGYAGILDE